MINTIAGKMTDIDSASAVAQATKSVSKSATQAADIIGSLSSSASKWDSLTEAQQAEVANIKATYLNQGGVIISSDDSSEATKNLGNYDYRVTLREHELDTQGVTGYFNSSYVNGTYSASDYEAILEQKVEDGTLSQEVSDYLLGKDSDLTFEGMTYEQLKEFDNGLNSLEDIQYGESGNFITYITSKYSNVNELYSEVSGQ